jgi:hypothetical protein
MSNTNTTIGAQDFAVVDKNLKKQELPVALAASDVVVGNFHTARSVIVPDDGIVTLGDSQVGALASQGVLLLDVTAQVGAGSDPIVSLGADTSAQALLLLQKLGLTEPGAQKFVRVFIEKGGVLANPVATAGVLLQNATATYTNVRVALNDQVTPTATALLACTGARTPAEILITNVTDFSLEVLNWKIHYNVVTCAH